WSEAVDVALCFGWIDSKKIKINDDTSHQFFSKRKAKSTWSKINKEKIDKLIAEGLMTDAGYKSIEVAKENGSWTILDSVEELIIPADLEEAFNIHEGAKDYFLSLSKSSKKMLLHWVVLAKLPLTRQKRIDEIALQAGKQQKPKNF
ncbi:MAG: YdeI/OmpD-associated family protein, partial [Flavobacterium sp.]